MSIVLARMGVGVAVVGAGFDLWCDSVYILVFPRLAAFDPPQHALFLVVEQMASPAWSLPMGRTPWPHSW